MVDMTRKLTHILPAEDERVHVEDEFCPCLPTIIDGLVRHNSYDGREVGQVCRQALDLLGRALADEGHEWIDEERDAYEHAIELLNMHWPPMDSELPMEGID